MLTLNTCAMTCRAGSGATGTRSASAPGALEERRRVAFGGIRHEPHDDLQQLRDPGAGLGRGEAHRHQVSLAQRLLKRVVQLLRGDLLALLEVERHQLLVELDHLVDDLGVGGLDRGESPRRGRAAGRNSRPPSRRRRRGGSAAGTRVPKDSRSWASTCAQCASRLSILLTMMRRHRPRSRAKSMRRWVRVSTPLTALTTMATASTASSTERVLPRKSG